MKEHFEKYLVYYLIVSVILAGAGIFFGVYFPHFSHEISENNMDWGNFGAFFWGFGTMCFTGLNVYFFASLTKNIKQQDKTLARQKLNYTKKRYRLEMQRNILDDYLKYLNWIFDTNVITEDHKVNSEWNTKLEKPVYYLGNYVSLFESLQGNKVLDENIQKMKYAQKLLVEREQISDLQQKEIWNHAHSNLENDIYDILFGIYVILQAEYTHTLKDCVTEFD